jgi:dienelactone hydrolase
MQTLLLLALSFSFSSAAVKSQTVEYKHGDTVLEGYLAYDNQGPKKKPAVLVVHNWKGVSADTRERADMLARLGYVAFAVDIYGKGVRPADQKEAGAMAGKFKADRPLMRARMQAALDHGRAQPQTDPKRVAAIGYCFGGTAALELARAGADVAGVVSFHGGLDNPQPSGKNPTAKVLVLHGADDPYVPDAEVKGFEDEMRKAQADWQLVKYSGAVHSFTEKAAGNDNSKGAAYNATADRRSWEAMRAFFAEIF